LPFFCDHGIFFLAAVQTSCRRRHFSNHCSLRKGFTSEKLQVFISYSRDDLEFADQLAAGLRVGGIDPTIDRQEISGGEDWRRRLGSLIRDAETVVFVFSPSSARSETCGWEVEEAARLGKRIVPVVCRPLGSAIAPPGLQNLNYVFFYAEPKSPGSGFGSGLEQLVAALNTDIDWLREHTRYLQRATEWDSARRPESRLLYGADIATAKAWAARRPKGAPEPTALHLDFIRASENWEAQEQREERKRLEEIQQALKVMVAWEYTEKDPSVSAALLREAKEPASIRGWRGATSKTLEMLGFSSKFPLVPTPGVRSAKFSPDGRRIVTASEDGTLRVCEGETGEVIAVLRGHTGAVSSAVFSPDGHRIVTGSRDGTVKVWDAENGRALLSLETRGSNLSVLPSPDSRNILTTLNDGSSQLWEAASGRLIFSIKDAFGAAFSPDGTTIVTISGHTAKLLDSMTSLEIARLEGHKGPVVSAVFSPDGHRIVTASNDNTVRIWEARTGSPLFTLVGHTDALSGAAFGPDGKFIVTASFDYTARIWDAESGREHAVLKHPGPVWAASFSPDGRYVATASDDGKARLWNLNRSFLASQGQLTAPK
jgi:WD40 repeat protein